MLELSWIRGQGAERLDCSWSVFFRFLLPTASLPRWGDAGGVIGDLLGKAGSFGGRPVSRFVVEWTRVS